MVKTHSKTGLKYLCQTKRTDYEKYLGSGLDWKKHLKEHGNEVETLLLKECLDDEELRRWGKYYSDLWNVVESKEWANKIPELGTGFWMSQVNIGKVHEKTECTFCGQLIPKNTITQHSRSCEKNTSRVPINTKKHPKEKCSFCNRNIDSYQLEIHENSCNYNPNKIEHFNTGMIYKKCVCDHCGKNISSNMLIRHTTTCINNPNRKKSFECKPSICEFCGLVGKGGNMKRYHHENCKSNPINIKNNGAERNE